MRTRSDSAARWWTTIACWIAALALQALLAPWWHAPRLAQASPESASNALSDGSIASCLPPWQAFAQLYPWLLLALIALAFAWRDRRQEAARRRETAALERLASEARLETLRTQLDPHFLFNALNAIAAHLERDPRAARWMLDQLGSLLRMSLDQAREQETPLAGELAFIGCYLDLQQARFDNRLDVVMTIAPEVRRAIVPSLILQPLVENAVRHGAAHQPGARIAIRAWRDGDRLHLSVHDNGPGLPADWDPEHGLGVGLSITRERLQRLYGAAQAFTIAGDPGAGVRVALTLPFRLDSSNARAADIDETTTNGRSGDEGSDVRSALGHDAGSDARSDVGNDVEVGSGPGGKAKTAGTTAAGGARTRIADDSPGS